ncbi:hypothetical protein JAAARDRAFT_184588 [Jaapia argillacea MUCL 33604]|uniref:Heme haloperoxidase family profile domain-containing protein n=1 Tax=Jaapia argillacea MUCL 33604 TaxID=933084 RepID=A0A067PAT2_9AGAM|nr:hypothetical protein JAAARDRAFT_184588 [Jaapia argillacea MUCL 33604]
MSLPRSDVWLSPTFWSRFSIYNCVSETITTYCRAILIRLHLVSAVSLSERTCPHDHSYVPRKATDSRSPCPALNTLANHGFIPRDGRGINYKDLIKGLQHGYNLSYPLAAFLTLGGYYLLKQYDDISLDDLCRHNRIEHISSLAHNDPVGNAEYAPNVIDCELFDELLKDSADGKTLSSSDVVRARVRREATYDVPIDPVHAEIARGEMALVLGIFGGPEEKVPLDHLRVWFAEERIPDDWLPVHQQTLRQTIKTATRIRTQMNAIKTREERRSTDG